MEQKILNEMRNYFGEDKKRIAHAENVLKHAKQIMSKKGGDKNVIIASAILHDIGIKECERKYNSTNGKLQEKEGPGIARIILKNLNINEKIINEVCEIIANHHTPGKINTLNFNILFEADTAVNKIEKNNI